MNTLMYHRHRPDRRERDIIPFMTEEDMLHVLERKPFVPLRLHLASGQIMDISYAGTAWIRQNTVLVVHPLARNASAIDNYDVVSLELIQRIEQIGEPSAA